jgi:hypothetical protein
MLAISMIIVGLGRNRRRYRLIRQQLPAVGIPSPIGGDQFGRRAGAKAHELVSHAMLERQIGGGSKIGTN